MYAVILYPRVYGVSGYILSTDVLYLAQNSPELGCGDECATKGCQGVGSFPGGGEQPSPSRRDSALRTEGFSKYEPELI